MILDHLDRAGFYDELHDGFTQAFAFLKQTDLQALLPGRIELVKDLLYANVDHLDGRGREGAVLSRRTETR